MPNNHRWLLVDGLAWSAQQVRNAWTGVPPRARRRWLLVLGLGWLSTGLLTYFLALFGRRLAEQGFFDGEEALLERILATSPLSFGAAIYLSVPTDTLFLVVVIVSATLFALWRGHALHGFSILATLVLVDLAIAFGWISWNRARPDFLYGGIASPGLHSFPSGHVAQAVVIYGFFAYLWVRATQHLGEKLLAVFLALIVIAGIALARLELGVHWLSDVVAGVVIGGWLLAAFILALRGSLAVVEA